MAFIEKEYDLDTKSSTFTLGKTETAPGEVIEFDTSELSAEMRDTLMLHGLNQKLGDSIASIKGKLAKERGCETKEVPDADVLPAAIEALNDLWTQLKNNDWRAARGEGESKPRIGEVATALARLQNIAVEAAVVPGAAPSTVALAAYALCIAGAQGNDFHAVDTARALDRCTGERARHCTHRVGIVTQVHCGRDSFFKT
jgi:hypothetical protein